MKNKNAINWVFVVNLVHIAPHPMIHLYLHIVFLWLKWKKRLNIKMLYPSLIRWFYRNREQQSRHMIHMKERFPFLVTGDGGERLCKIYSRSGLKEDRYSYCKTRKIGAYVFWRKRNLQYIGTINFAM